MALTPDQVIEIAKQQNPSNPALAIWQYAQSQGMSPEQIDAYMGWNPGTSQGWAVQNGLMSAPNGSVSNNVATPTNSAGIPLKVDPATLASYNEMGSTGTFYKADPSGTEWIYDANGNLLNGVKVSGNTNQYLDKNGAVVSTGQRGTNEGIQGLSSIVQGTLNDPTFWKAAAVAAGVGAVGNGLFGASSALPTATAADTAALTASTMTPEVTAGLTGAGVGTTAAGTLSVEAGLKALDEAVKSGTVDKLPTWFQNLIPGLLTASGGLISGQSATDAAKTQADAQIRAAQIAADAAKFKPVGVTTNFGSSQFGYDANGNLTSAGYQLAPGLQAAIGTLGGQAQGLLNQAGQAQSATAPMVTAAQRAMSLGQGYLATDPQAQAAKYLSEQHGLLAPSRAADMASLQAQMQAQGRGGFAIGGGVNGQGAANPQLQALLNAQMQQDAQLAASATQGGMDYAKFGAGMVGTGGDLLSSMYGVQNAAYTPLNTTLNTAKGIEGMGQNAMQLGMDLGGKTSAATAASGLLSAQGMTNAANTMAPANAYSPWGSLLSGAGQSMQGYKFDPMTGVKL